MNQTILSKKLITLFIGRIFQYFIDMEQLPAILGSSPITVGQNLKNCAIYQSLCFLQSLKSIIFQIFSNDKLQSTLFFNVQPTMQSNTQVPMCFKYGHQFPTYTPRMYVDCRARAINIFYFFRRGVQLKSHLFKAQSTSQKKIMTC